MSGILPCNLELCWGLIRPVRTGSVAKVGWTCRCPGGKSEFGLSLVLDFLKSVVLCSPLRLLRFPFLVPLDVVVLPELPLIMGPCMVFLCRIIVCNPGLLDCNG